MRSTDRAWRISGFVSALAKTVAELETQRVTPARLEAALKAWTSAECRGGFLFAQDQSGNDFGKVVVGKNYHGLDYALFAMDIRENAKARAAAYLSQIAVK